MKNNFSSSIGESLAGRQENENPPATPTAEAPAVPTVEALK